MQQPQACEVSINTSIKAIIGVNASERILPQLLHINFTIFKSKLSKAELLLPIKKLLKEYTEQQQPQLLEKLAYDLARLFITKCQIDDFRLTIEKPEAFKEAQCSYVSLRTRVELA